MALSEEQAKAYMHKLLGSMVQQSGSDLFISADFPPSMKAHGAMTPMASQKLTGEITRTLAHSLMNMGYKKGGSVSSASKRADGCCVKGKTRGKMV